MISNGLKNNDLCPSCRCGKIIEATSYSDEEGVYYYFYCDSCDLVCDRYDDIDEIIGESEGVNKVQELGWCIRKIKSVSENSVQLSDGVSFMSDCFSGAKVGETWAVKYETGFGLGRIRRASLLESPDV